MTVNARTDAETGLRFYVWRGRDYPSVTSIRRIIGTPFGLVQWQISKIVTRAVEQYEELGALLNREAKPRERKRDENVLKEAKTWLRKAATEERDKAGDRGTAAHEAIEQGLRPQDIEDPEVRAIVSQFVSFLDDTGAEVIWAERQVFNLTDGYAGTCDALMRVRSHGNRVFVVDYKTSKGVHIDYALQLMAYAMGEFVGENDVIDKTATAQLKEADGMAVLHLSTEGWEFIEIEATPSLFTAFTSSVKLASFLHEHEGIDGLVVSITEGKA